MSASQIALLLACVAVALSGATALALVVLLRGVRRDLRLLHAGRVSSPRPAQVAAPGQLGTAVPVEPGVAVEPGADGGSAVTPVPLGADDEPAPAVRRTVTASGTVIKVVALAYGLRSALAAEGRTHVALAYRRELHAQLRAQRRAQRSAAWARAGRQVRDAWRRP